jgi:hypothetical protein
MPWCSFLVVRRFLQRPPPTLIRPYLLASKKALHIQVPSVSKRVFRESMALKSSIGLTNREILVLVYRQCFEKTLVWRLPDSPDSPRLSCPQPSRAWHGNRVTTAHHEEVGVSADGHASAPHFGAAAALPPTGAIFLRKAIHWCGWGAAMTARS